MQMQKSVLKQIDELNRMSMAELRKRWADLLGTDPGRLGRQYLIRRLAYRIQELAYGGLSQEVEGVCPRGEYLIRLWAKGEGVGHCWFGGGPGWSLRKYFPTGDFDWRPLEIRWKAPVNVSSFSLRINVDSVTTALWIDDITLEEADPRTGLTANWEPRPYASAYPRASQPPAEHLAVLREYGLYFVQFGPCSSDHHQLGWIVFDNALIISDWKC